MTLIAVPIYVPSPEAIPHVLERARGAAEMGATLVEWRVDELAQSAESISAIRRLVRVSPMPCIITCRPAGEGGRFQGEEETRWRLFEQLLRSDDRPRLIDIELRTWLNAPHEHPVIASLLEEGKSAGDGGTSLILSAHDFERRPADLLQRIEAMTNEPVCDVIKLAWTARSLRDNLEVFDILRDRKKPTIALCMGEFGLISRILAPKFGGFLTFAADALDGETAPGQPTIRQLRELFRFDAITRETRVYGVIGWPVSHSLSPRIHNAGFTEIDHDGVYLPLPIPPEYEHFKATVGALIDQPGLNFRGASVTIPHKENLLRFVIDRGGRMDAMSEAIGAANTLIVGSAGGIECRNTDGPAAVDALCDAMNMSREELGSTRIAVLGAGGVARAVIAAVSGAGAAVVVFNRTRQRAEKLVRELHGRAAANGGAARVMVGEPDAQQDADGGGFDVLINCTSVGMAGGPAPDELPLPRGIALNDRVTVFETVYAPARTPLVRDAEARGAKIVFGLDMFVRQAAMQFQAWTGKPAPVETFTNALEAVDDERTK